MRYIKDENRYRIHERPQTTLQKKHLTPKSRGPKKCWRFHETANIVPRQK